MLTEDNQKKLIRARKALGLTQGQLAKKAGISRPVINTIERGACGNITFKTLESITKALDLRLELKITRPVKKSSDRG